MLVCSGDSPLERRSSIKLIKAVFQLFSLADSIVCWVVKSWGMFEVPCSRTCSTDVNWKSWTSALRRTRASRADLRESNCCANLYSVCDSKMLNGAPVRGRASDPRRMKIGTIMPSNQEASVAGTVPQAICARKERRRCTPWL